MRLLDIDDKYSLVNYINEDCISSYKMKANMERIDEQFFKPWAKYLEEAQLSPDQINKIFTAAHKEAQASGANSTMLGKVVEKIIPDSMLQKLSDSLPEPDPNAANDPQFANKAGAAVNQLPVDAEAKSGLMKIVANAAKNPAVQPMVLSLVGGVLGGLVQKVGPYLNTMGLPGTVVAGVAGAVVAGGVAVAAAKIQGKSWKDAFKGAIKPALAGAAGAVLGKMAADFVGSIGSGGSSAADGGSRAEMDAAVEADRKLMGDLQSKYPPDKYEFSGQGERLTVIDRATGEPVQTFQGLTGKTMDTATLADLANNNPQTPNMNIQGDRPVGRIDWDAEAAAKSGGTNLGAAGRAAEEAVSSGAVKDYASAQKAAGEYAAALEQQGVNPRIVARAEEVFMTKALAGTVGGSGQIVQGQPVPDASGIQAAQASSNYRTLPDDPTGMGAASDYKPVDTGSLRQGGAPGGVAFPGDPGYVPPDEAGKIKPVWRNKTRMPQGVSDSREYRGNRLSEGQCYLVLKRVAATNRDMIVEGHLILEAGLLQKAGSWLKTKAQNVTQQVTADKLMQAWKKAGSPTDSNAVADIMQQSGVNPDVVTKVYKDMKLPAPGSQGTADQVDFKSLSDQIMKMDPDTKVKIVNYMKNDLKVA